VWKWAYDGNEMYMDVGETVRLRVTGVKFNPPPPPAHTQQKQGAPDGWVARSLALPSSARSRQPPNPTP